MMGPAPHGVKRTDLGFDRLGGPFAPASERWHGGEYYGGHWGLSNAAGRLERTRFDEQDEGRSTQPRQERELHPARIAERHGDGVDDEAQHRGRGRFQEAQADLGEEVAHRRRALRPPGGPGARGSAS